MLRIILKGVPPIYAFVITLREGLEAALIIGILVAYLRKIRRPDGLAPIWAGAGAALALSILAGMGIVLTIGELSGAVLDVFEAAAMLLAVGVLTYMVFWMGSHARHLKAQLHREVDSALSAGSRLALAVLAFSVVVREGVETVLFLAAGAMQSGSGARFVLLALAGLLAAGALGYLLYRGSVRLDLRRFFLYTGLLLILFAAGLLSNAFKELQEVRLVPPVIPHVWDTYHLVSDTGPLGRLLGALFGYDASPSLVQVVAYLGYLLVAGWFYLRPARPGEHAPPAVRA